MSSTQPLGVADATAAVAPAARSASAWARTLKATMRVGTGGAWQAVEPTTDPAAGAPALRGRTLAPRLAAGRGHAAPPADDGGRYAIGGALGRGATAAVWAVFDHALGRELAAKVLDGDTADVGAVDAFIAEARTTASLQHPNVAPVHELDIAADGRPYFTMQRVEGRSLGDQLADAAAGAAPPPPVNTVVSIVIAIANALAYAHHRGIVHQDVKPDNVMLGAFGAVLLVDWGSAQRLADLPLRICGTPLYMAPEQARREAVDARSDIYALGATLFQALLLRPPTWAEAEDAFWRRKRDGDFDPPTAAERAAVPAPLLAVTLQAIAADPAKRYQTVEAMIDDLRSFQAGLAVSAEHAGAARRAARWCRRNARNLAVVVPALASVVVLALLLTGQRLKQMATWGAPVFVEDGRDPTLARWATAEGAFAVRDGALVSTEPLGSALVMRERIDGEVAIDYDAWFAPGARPGDLSVMWCPAVAFDGAGRATIDYSKALEVQFGGHDASFTELTVGSHHVYAIEHPQPGRRYHVRIEIRDNVLTLAIDGLEVCRHVDPLPLPAGHLALYGYYAGKSFANIRVFVRRPPELLPATAVGDSWFRAGANDVAVAEYERVRAAHPGTALAAEAAFRAGLGRWRAGDRDGAGDAWRAVAGTAWDDEVALLRIDDAIVGGDHAAAIAAIDACAAARTGLARRLDDEWSTAVEALATGRSTPRTRAWTEAYLGLRDHRLGATPGTAIAAARGLLFLERWQEVLDRFPGQHRECCDALAGLGRIDQVPDAYPDQTTKIEDAILATARWDEYARRLGDLPDRTRRDNRVLREQGRDREVLARDPGDQFARMDRGDFAGVDWWGAGVGYYRAMSLLGRAGEIAIPLPRLGRYQILDLDKNELVVLMASGRIDEAVRLAEQQPTLVAWPRFLVGVRRAAAGDAAGAARWFAVPAASAFIQWRSEPARTLIPPLVAELAGERGAVAAAAARTCAERRWADAQRPWYIARRLGHDLDDAAFRAQPYQLFVDADLDLTRAVDADRDRDPAAALAAYRAWARRPAWQRAEVLDPVLDEFVAWRIAALGAPDGADDEPANDANR